MPDVLLFGATGYTGRLTAAALARRGIPYIACGRDPQRLDRVVADHGAAEGRVASVGDVPALVRALKGTKVMISCVGPFLQFGETAVQAALEAGVHYTDSTGEGAFVDRLIARDEEFRAAGITVAPAMGFDEVPGDLAAALATEGMASPSLNLTYALPRHGSTGTIKSALGIMRSPARFIEEGRSFPVKAGSRSRWAPMPPPLGPRRAVAFPLAEGSLAPLHIGLRSLGTYVVAGAPERAALRLLSTPLGAITQAPGVDAIVDRIRGRGMGPADEQRAGGRWTILAEARQAGLWRNVIVTGTDPYALTAETLATAADVMRQPGYGLSGVASPVQALGMETLHQVLTEHDVEIEVNSPRQEG